MSPRTARLVLGVAAPLLALVAAFAITSLVLLVAGVVALLRRSMLSW